MNTPTKLGAFGLGLVATFGLASAVGAAVGPVGVGPVPSDHTVQDAGHTVQEDQ